jgi:hypothetical protein
MADIKSLASQGHPGALQRRYAHMRHPIPVGGASDDLVPADTTGQPKLPVAERYSAGRKYCTPPPAQSAT